MLMPFDRKRLARLNSQEDVAHQAESTGRELATGIQRGLDLSTFVRQLALATGASDGGQDTRLDLGEKSRLYVQPLLSLVGR